MVLTAIISLIIIGLILVIIEILFVPGTTVVGVVGLIISAVGIFFSFTHFETETAWVILVVAVILNFAALVYGLQSGVWKKMALTSEINSRAHDDRLLGLTIGMEGRTISDLRPFGKAEFENKIYEVKSDSGYVSVGTKVIIAKLKDNTITVKL
jgi:membrane-bound ClpP family serine protease